MGSLNRSDVCPPRTVRDVLLQQAMILYVVCNFHGHAGVVERLGELADIDVPALGAVASVALLVALGLYVAVGVARLSAFSLLTLWTLRARRPDNGASNTVTGQILLNFSTNALPRDVPTVGHGSRVSAWWSLGTWRTRGARKASELRTLQVASNFLQAVATTT